MKGTNKGPSPESLEVWKTENFPLYTDGVPPWGTIPGQVRTDIKECLWREQGGLCAYCGRRIALGESFNGPSKNHIEHFRPRHSYRPLTFEHDNLLLSCGDGYDEGEAPANSTCGTAKDSWFDENLFVPPDEAVCKRWFVFTDAGEINHHDRDNGSAAKMIDVLNLNDRQLVALRRGIWEAFLDQAREQGVAPDGDSLAQSDVYRFFTSPDGQGWLQPFSHVIAALTLR